MHHADRSLTGRGTDSSKHLSKPRPPTARHRVPHGSHGERITAAGIVHCIFAYLRKQTSTLRTYAKMQQVCVDTQSDSPPDSFLTAGRYASVEAEGLPSHDRHHAVSTGRTRSTSGTSGFLRNARPNAPHTGQLQNGITWSSFVSRVDSSFA